jgi:hypothetical protein
VGPFGPDAGVFLQGGIGLVGGTVRVSAALAQGIS